MKKFLCSVLLLLGLCIPALSDVNLYHTLFVDGATGSDTYSVRGDIRNPWKTLAGAKAAAATNDLIYVFPGNYADVDQSGATWYFSPGVTGVSGASANSPKYLGVVAVSLNHGSVSRGFGFKYSNDGTNWFTLIQQAATIPSNSCYAPALTHIGTNWIVAYDVYAIAPPAISNVWAQMVSSDLVNWTGPTFFTNSSISPGSLVGGERFYKDPNNGVTYQYLPFWSPAPYYMWSVCLTNVNDVNSWGNPALVSTNADDVGIVVGDDGRYYMASGTLNVNISTNSGTTATNAFALARSDVLALDPWESPQMFRLGVSNYIMFANHSPATEYKTYYSTATHPFGPWATPQPINEDGNAPSRMDIYQLNASESLLVRSLIASNSLAKPYVRSYTLATTAGATNATGPFLEFGSAAGRVKFDVLGIGSDDGTTYGAFAVHFSYEITAVELYGSLKFIVSQKYYDVSRPDATFGVSIQTNSGAVDLVGDSAYGWRNLKLLVYSPNTVAMNWVITEELKTVAGFTNGNFILNSPFGSGVTYPVGAVPPLGAAGGGTYSMVETNIGIWAGDGSGLTNLQALASAYPAALTNNDRRAVVFTNNLAVGTNGTIHSTNIFQVSTPGNRKLIEATTDDKIFLSGQLTVTGVTNSGVGATGVVVTDANGKEVKATLSGLTLSGTTLSASSVSYSGTTNIGAAATSLLIQIGHTMPSASYTPSVSILGNALGTGVAASYSSLTTTTFTLNLSGVLGAADNLAWSVIYSP